MSISQAYVPKPKQSYWMTFLLFKNIIPLLPGKFSSSAFSLLLNVLDFFFEYKQQQQQQTYRSPVTHPSNIHPNTSAYAPKVTVLLDLSCNRDNIGHCSFEIFKNQLKITNFR